MMGLCICAKHGVMVVVVCVHVERGLMTVVLCACVECEMAVAVQCAHVEYVVMMMMMLEYAHVKCNQETGLKSLKEKDLKLGLMDAEADPPCLHRHQGGHHIRWRWVHCAQFDSNQLFEEARVRLRKGRLQTQGPTASSGLPTGHVVRYPSRLSATCFSSMSV